MALSEGTITSIGSVAAVLTTVAFVPQVVRVWRLKDARDISSATFGVFAAGVLVWFVYGLLIPSFPIVFANGITFVLALWILALKRRYDRGPAHMPS